MSIMNDALAQFQVIDELEIVRLRLRPDDRLAAWLYGQGPG